MRCIFNPEKLLGKGTFLHRLQGAPRFGVAKESYSSHCTKVFFLGKLWMRHRKGRYAENGRGYEKLVCASGGVESERLRAGLRQRTGPQWSALRFRARGKGRQPHRR